MSGCSGRPDFGPRLKPGPGTAGSSGTWPRRPDSQKSNGITELKAFSGETGKPVIKIDTTHGDVQVDPAGK